MSGREHFGSRAAVIMAMAGSAIGLGNIWRFPFIVGEYGGAAFVLVYIFCCFLLSLPILLSESVIGRRTHQGTFGAMNALAPWDGMEMARIPDNLFSSDHPVLLQCSGRLVLRVPSQGGHLAIQARKGGCCYGDVLVVLLFCMGTFGLPCRIPGFYGIDRIPGS